MVFGSAGAFLGNRLRIPVGVLVGTLVGVGGAVSIGSVLLGLPQLPTPPGTMALLQIALGMLVGFRMTREELRSGVHALLPASLLAAVLISASIGVALAVARFTSVDVVTALFAAAPGALTEMSAVSVTFGADGAAVASVQLVRVLLAVAILDVLLARLESKGKPEQDNREQDGEEQDYLPAGKTGYAQHLKHLAVSAPWGILGGLAGIASQAPAGGIIGALVGSAAFRLLSDRPVPIRGFQVGVQILSGVVIGLGVSGEFFSKLTLLAGAGALIILTQMLLWLATGWLLAKLFRYDVSTSALASSPGGISGVVAAASEAGADEVVVTFIHLLRLSLVIVVVPVFVALVFGSN